MHTKKKIHFLKNVYNEKQMHDFTQVAKMFKSFEQDIDSEMKQCCQTY